MARSIHLTASDWSADTSEVPLETTVGRLLRDAAADAPDRVALVEAVAEPALRRRWTYAELLRSAEIVARAAGPFRPG